MFSAIQAAQLVAANPAITTIADSIFYSAGGTDQNEAPLIQAPQQPIQQPMQEIPQNTSPGFPALPVQPAPTPAMPEQSMPVAPSHGANRGIETTEFEG